eukprot:CAMPEP_0119014708 /NCGR_PEP_ID=MMETSP1176-20130426/10247_1 /TAXON_ID=265551 /ORGANISM="Synedropsis recta cf, Strain CCMP1620" /LENGTH=189 /DNA_ID=CAMNT_0006967931 /DNA_START=92 /DNA_END=661 /DNA_ORIENTATION=-
MASFDTSEMDPETYFEQALELMGMSMKDDASFALTTCPPLCKCSMCDSLNRSSRSFTTTTTSSTAESEEDALSSHSSDRDHVVVVKRMHYMEGEPASRELPISEYSSLRSSSLSSLIEYDKDTDDDHIREMEREVKRLQARDRELERQRLRLEAERDNLKLALNGVANPDLIGSPNSTKLEQIREHDEE